MTKSAPPPKATTSRVRSPGQLQPGVILRGGYRIERKVAAGGTAWVFEARHIESDRRVAVKVLNDQYRGEPNVVKRFTNEARAAMALDSPHIVKVEAVGRLHDGLPFLVMEYLEGADLYHVLAESGWRLPTESALYIVDQVARALEVAHEKGIIHRDIKPENIFVLDRPGGPLAKVVDFGLSRVPADGSHSKLTRTGMTVGTPHYMALEQLRGDKSIDGRADVYALGVLTYELLSGRCPFEGDDPREVMLRAARDEPPPLTTYRPDLPQGLIEAIAYAMRRDRSKRCPSAAAFREALRPYWSGVMPDFESSATTPSEPPANIDPPPPQQPSLPPELPLATSTPLPTSSSPPPSPVPRKPHRPVGTFAAIMIAALVLALGLTCFIVDAVRGTPGARAQAAMLQ